MTTADELVEKVARSLFESDYFDEARRNEFWESRRKVYEVRARTAIAVVVEAARWIAEKARLDGNGVFARANNETVDQIKRDLSALSPQVTP